MEHNEKRRELASRRHRVAWTRTKMERVVGGGRRAESREREKKKTNGKKRFICIQLRCCRDESKEGGIS
jgi:hypothetical protein